MTKVYKIPYGFLNPGDCLGFQGIYCYSIYRYIGCAIGDIEDGYLYIEVLHIYKNKIFYFREKCFVAWIDRVLESASYIMNSPIALGREEFKVVYK